MVSRLPLRRWSIASSDSWQQQRSKGGEHHGGLSRASRLLMPTYSTCNSHSCCHKEGQTTQRQSVRLGQTGGNTELRKFAITPVKTGAFDLFLAVEYNQMIMESFKLPVDVLQARSSLSNSAFIATNIGYCHPCKHAEGETADLFIMRILGNAGQYHMSLSLTQRPRERAPGAPQ